MKAQKRPLTSLLLVLLCCCSLSAQPDCGPLACITEINLTLSDSCRATLLPTMVLTGDSSCIAAGNFTVTVADTLPGNGAVIDGCGRFRYTISAPGNDAFDGCWGFVTAEDKTPPSIDSLPEPPFLFCSDFDRSTLLNLDPTVDSCYFVNPDGSFNAYVTRPGRRPITELSRFLTTDLGRRLERTGGLPRVTDGCADLLQLCLTDRSITTDEDGCDDLQLERIITAREIGGCTERAEGENAGATSYTITFVRPSLDDLGPDNINPVVRYDCRDRGIEVDRIPDPRPADFPFFEIDSNRLFLRRTDGAGALCNFVTAYEDGPLFRSCNATLKTVRTYTVVDWCNPDSVLTFTQVVKIGDTAAPTFTGPTQDRNFDNEPDDGPLLFPTNSAGGCGAFFRLDDPTIEVTDNCSFGIFITASIFPDGDTTATAIGSFVVDPNDGDAELSGEVPVGQHLLRYEVVDDCGNRAFYDFDILVQDITPPVAICEDGLNVSLSGEGTAVLTADRIDAGSYDGCSDVTLALARVGSNDLPATPFAPTLALDCSDLGEQRIGLRATDAGGRFNDCWLTVLVEDKERPVCLSPFPLTLSCQEAREVIPADATTLSAEELDQLFGRAAVTDNCPGLVVEQQLTGGLNNCGRGSFLRRFGVTDAQGFTAGGACQQRITVFPVHEYTVSFPPDLSGDCGAQPFPLPPRGEELGCDLLAFNTLVDTFQRPDAAACYKLAYTYEVINWCEYDGLAPAIDLPRAEGRPQFLRIGTGGSLPALADDEARFGPSATGNNPLLVTDYGIDDRRGFFRYVQYVRVYDTTEPELTALVETDGCFSGRATDCSAAVTLPFLLTDFCGRPTVTGSLDRNYNPTGGFQPGLLPEGAIVRGAGDTLRVELTGVLPGSYAVRLRADDGCGNFTTLILPFCVVADRPPAPICIQSTTVTLMPSPDGEGAAVLWATDLVASPGEDCRGNRLDRYAIYREEEIGDGQSPDFPRPELRFSCADNFVTVRVYAYDGEQSGYCVASVEVQDNAGVCFSAMERSIAGRVATTAGQPLSGLTVSVTGPDDLLDQTTTDDGGQYAFPDLSAGDYTVEPRSPLGVDLRAVKTSDIIGIQRHILGARLLPTAYDFLAADVTGDREVDIFDLIAIRRVILGVATDFPGGESWLFVPADFPFDYQPGEPLRGAFPQVLNVNQLNGRLEDGDLIAVQRGNVVP